MKHGGIKMSEFTSIIGITGKARHGKDTVGRMLGEMLPCHWHYAFAFPIKEFVHAAMVAEERPVESKESPQEFYTNAQLLNKAIIHLEPALKMYGGNAYIWIQQILDTIQETHEDSFRINGESAYFTSSWRKLYQIIGTEWGRQKVNNRIWVDPFLPFGSSIITDVRAYGDSEDRDVEAKAILDKGGMIIRVVDPRKGDCIRSHSSEAGVSEAYISTTIYNNGSLDSLRRKVQDLVRGRILCRNQ